jgi:hypothetical protein
MNEFYISSQIKRKAIQKNKPRKRNPGSKIHVIIPIKVINYRTLLDSRAIALNLSKLGPGLRRLRLGAKVWVANLTSVGSTLTGAGATMTGAASTFGVVFPLLLTEVFFEAGFSVTATGSGFTAGAGATSEGVGTSALGALDSSNSTKNSFFFPPNNFLNMDKFSLDF